MQIYCEKSEEYLQIFTRRFPACVFNRFPILKGNAGIQYYTDVVLLVSRETVTPNSMRISFLIINNTETYIRINVYKHFCVGKQ